MSTINRRRFLGISASAVSSFMIVPRHVLGGKDYTAPSDKLNIAAIGVAGQGASDLENLESENIVSLCDVDWAHAAETFKRYPKANKYRDFRIMLEKEKNIDAVLVATPDHTHAIASMYALKMGKHLYCEKPLTHTLYEARQVAETAREAKVATQMGNQGMAYEGNRLINEWIWDGAIGQVHEVHVWSDRPTRLGTRDLWWPQALDRPVDEPEIPSLGIRSALSVSCSRGHAPRKTALV
jgi:predicted dehydrogenase